MKEQKFPKKTQNHQLLVTFRKLNKTSFLRGLENLSTLDYNVPLSISYDLVAGEFI